MLRRRPPGRFAHFGFYLLWGRLRGRSSSADKWFWPVFQRGVKGRHFFPWGAVMSAFVIES